MKDGMVNGLLYKKGWRTVGPGGGGAQFYPGISPHDDKHMIVFCDMQGTYMTRDGGKNWRNMSLRAGGKSSAFDPARPNVVYVGSTGLYRSEDYGCTWEVILPKPEDITGEYWSGDEAMHTFKTRGHWVSGAIQSIALYNENNTEGIAIAQGFATNPHGDRLGGDMNIFYSEDGGKNWRSAEPLPKGLRFRHTAFDPSAGFPRLYAFTSEAVYRVDCRDMSFEEIPLPEGETAVFSADAGLDPKTGGLVLYLYTLNEEGKNLYRSNDGGASWKKLNYGILSSRGGVGDGKGLACCPNDASVIYLSIYRRGEFNPNEGNYEGVKKSTDYGETWEWSIAIDNDFPAHVTKGWMETHYGYTWPEPPITMSVAPGNPDVCVYTTFGTSMRTDDGGKHWYPIYSEPQPDGAAMGRGLEVTTCYSVHFDPHNKNNLFISYTDIGAFRSTDGGRTWHHAINGIPRMWRNTCYDAVYDPDIPGKMWSGWGLPHDIPRYKLVYKNGFKRGERSRQGGVAISTDNGENWVKSNEGMGSRSVITSLALDPASPKENRTLYAASWGTGVYRSDDGGKTWMLKNNGLGEEPFSWKIYMRKDGALILCNARGEKELDNHEGRPADDINNLPMSLAYGKKDERTVDGGIFISTDRAESWRKLTLPKYTNFPNDIALDPRDPNVFYVTMWPYDTKPGHTAEHGGVYKTTDSGQSWTRMPLPAHVEYTYGVTVDEKNPDTVYVVDFQQNAHRSDDGGKTWRRLGGYSVKWGHKAFPDPHNEGMLYITTFGSSVFYGPAEGNGEPYDDVLIIKNLER